MDEDPSGLGDPWQGTELRPEAPTGVWVATRFFLGLAATVGLGGGCGACTVYNWVTRAPGEPYGPIAAMACVGVYQLLWVVPVLVVLWVLRERHAAAGVAVGAALVFVVNATCDVLVAHTGTDPTESLRPPAHPTESLRPPAR